MHFKQLARLGGCAAAAVALTSGPALADEPTGTNDFEVGGFAGAHIFNDDNELGVDDQADSNSPENSIAAGIRLGYNFTPMFAAEGELAVMPTSSREGDVPVSVFGWRVNGLAYLTEGKVQPFALLGAGFLTASPRDKSEIFTDTDFVVHAGVGAKYGVGDNWGVRADVRILFPPSTSSEFVTTDWEFFVGLYKTFGVSSPKPDAAPPEGDRDNDGVGDEVDKCPELAEDRDGFEDQDGCPDTDDDGDGIPDTIDACPQEAEDKNGVDDNDGCPETDVDGDGIVGSADRCPADAEDNDGFQDSDGCPDTDNDGDGVTDQNDKCPTTLETPNNYQDNDGCPDEIPVAVAKFTGTIKGINFRTGSATILASSNRTLGEAAKVLTGNPTVRLEVQGHTDNVGDRAFNISLSQRRAAAVVRYLVGKRVNAARLVSKGYGPDQPVADNGTAAGKAKNRRVDFVLIAN